MVRSNLEVSLLLVVGAILLLATAACGGAGQAREGSEEAEAKVEPETATQERVRSAEATAESNESHKTLARVGDADDAVARAGNTRAQAGVAALEEGNEAPEGNPTGEEFPREDRPRQSHPEELTLKVGGDPGSEFSGVCSLGKEEKTIGGRVPQHYVFEPDATGLECEIRKEGGGALDVVVAGEGVRSVQRSGGAGQDTVRFAFSGDNTSYSISSISLNQPSKSSNQSSSNDPR